jgi:hypothetical protein
MIALPAPDDRISGIKMRQMIARFVENRAR